jgi:hypothetical protein
MHSIPRCLILLVSGLLCSSAVGQVKKAVVRAESSAAGENVYIDVTLGTPVKEGREAKGAVYDSDGNQISKSISVSSDRDHLRIDLPAGANPKGNDVVIYEYENDQGATFGGQVAAKFELGAKLTTGNPSCIDKRGQYFSIVVAPPRTAPRSDYLLHRLFAIYDQLAARIATGGSIGVLEVEAESQKDKEPLKIKSVELVPRFKTKASRGSSPGFSVEEQGGLFLCVTTDRPPIDQFDAAFTLSGGVPFELRGAILATELPGFSNIEVSSAADDTGNVGVRSLEKNLDLGLSLTSSVEDKEVTDPATLKKVNVRKRTTRGTLDFRFAPFLNTSFGYEHPKTGAWQSFYTPIFVDAKVSTGRIADDTLSLNRIVIGTEKEYRYQENTKRFPTFYRVILRGSHASDRDFKQGEYKFTGEFVPNLGPLVHPLTSFTSHSVHHLDNDPDRGVKLIPGVRGYEIRPVLGFEIGRTYYRRNPASAVKPSDTVRRFYFGGEILIDITERLNLKFSDTMYLRGESKLDRLHNYFIGEIDLPIGHRWNNTGFSLFASFERGGQPPFASPDVNVFKIGYRVQSRNWFDSFR